MKPSNRMSDDYQSENFNRDERYEIAAKRVKRIKGFYVHLLVYILVNIFIIAANSMNNSNNDPLFWSWQTFSTAFFWGIGLVVHSLSVFGKNLFFSSNWEEKKIQEFMDKDKSQKWE
jgi:hypothetical protein